MKMLCRARPPASANSPGLWSHSRFENNRVSNNECKEKKMNKTRMACLAIICLILGATSTVFAVPPNQVFRSTTAVEFFGPCCISLNESVQVMEPAKPMPVVVIWSADYVTFRNSTGGSVLAGLMVNGGPCQLYGSGQLSNTNVEVQRAFQWIVFPSDGLVPGLNTFALCGGATGINADSNVIDIFGGSLVVRLSK
jgi:hypothetical protein